MDIGLPWFDALPYTEKIKILDNADRFEKARVRNAKAALNYYYRVIEPAEIKADLKNHPLKERLRSKANHDNSKMRLDIIESYGMICHICNNPIHYTDFSIDHIIPISKGGTNNVDNLRPAHRSCNSKKGNKIWRIQDNPE